MATIAAAEVLSEDACAEEEAGAAEQPAAEESGEGAALERAERAEEAAEAAAAAAGECGVVLTPEGEVAMSPTAHAMGAGGGWGWWRGVVRGGGPAGGL